MHLILRINIQQLDYCNLSDPCTPAPDAIAPIKLSLLTGSEEVLYKSLWSIDYPRFFQLVMLLYLC